MQTLLPLFVLVALAAARPSSDDKSELIAALHSKAGSSASGSASGSGSERPAIAQAKPAKAKAQLGENADNDRKASKMVNVVVKRGKGREGKKTAAIYKALGLLDREKRSATAGGDCVRFIDMTPLDLGLVSN